MSHLNQQYNPWQRFVWLLILVCLTNACDPGLDCWLQNLTIPIKHTNFTQEQSTLIIDNIICNNITIPSFSSTLINALDVQLATSNMGMNCIGNWNISSPDQASNGTVLIVVNGSISLGITLVPDPSDYSFIEHVQADCNMDVGLISLIFYNYNGSTSTLSPFQAGVQGYVASQIEQISCPHIVQETTDGLMNQYSSFNTWATTQITNAMNLAETNASTTDFVDWQTNPILGLANYVLNDVVGSDGILSLNVLVNTLTNNTGAYSFNYGNFTPIQNFGYGTLPPLALSFGNVYITPLWVNISGLNTWSLAEFAIPVTNQTLNTYTVLEDLQLTVEFIVNVSFTDPVMKGGAMVHKAILNTTLSHNELFAQAFLGVSKELFSFLTSSQMLDPGCLAHTISLIQLTNLTLNFSMHDVAVTPAPDQIRTPTVDLVNDGIAVFLASYQPSLSEILNGFLWQPYSATSINMANYAWPKILNLKNCSDPTFDGITFNKITTFAACIAAVGIFFLLILISYLIVRFHEADDSEDSVAGEDYAESPINYKSDKEAVGEATALLEHDTGANYALMVNPTIPLAVRYGVVLVLLLNAAMFIASNSSLGASVYLIARTAEGSNQFPSLFNFSLVNSVRDMWNAKVYALSILIALFSGVWPYTKLVLLLLCWCTPAKILNVQRRGRILIMLDAMGKWSLIDSFVLILMMVAFHFSLAPPVSTYTPAGSIAFEAYVQPHFGFYSFLVATMLSLVITHFVIKIHELSLETEGQEYTDDTKEALWSHAASAEHPHKAAYMLTAVTVLLLASSVLLGFGITTQSFDFSFRGAFGVLLKFLGQSDSLSFSVISLGAAFPSSAIDPDSLGTRFIQVSFFIFAIGMPVAYLICLLVLWMVPLTYQFQSRLLTLTATIHAWSALEVFVISIIAALLELQQFAQFIIGNRCDMINKILAAYGNEILHGDDKCFNVVATLKTGCWVLFAACTIYVVVGSLVVKGCHNALKGRLERPYRVN